MTKEQLKRSARHPQQKKISFHQKKLVSNARIDLHLLWGRVLQVSPEEYKCIQPSVNRIKLEIVPIKNTDHFNIIFKKTWLPVMTQVHTCINKVKNMGFPKKSVQWTLFLLYNSNEIGPQQIFLTKLLQTCDPYQERDAINIAQDYIRHLYNSNSVGFCTELTGDAHLKSHVFPNVLYLESLNTQILPQYSDILKSLNYNLKNLNYGSTEIDGFL